MAKKDLNIPYKAEVEIMTAAPMKDKKSKNKKKDKKVKLKDIIEDIKKSVPKDLKEKVVIPTEVTGSR